MVIGLLPDNRLPPLARHYHIDLSAASKFVKDVRGANEVLSAFHLHPATRDRKSGFATDLYGAFPVKRLFLGFSASSLFGGVSR